MQGCERYFQALCCLFCACTPLLDKLRQVKRYARKNKIAVFQARQQRQLAHDGRKAAGFTQEPLRYIFLFVSA